MKKIVVVVITDMQIVLLKMGFLSLFENLLYNLICTFPYFNKSDKRLIDLI